MKVRKDNKDWLEYFRHYNNGSWYWRVNSGPWEAITYEELHRKLMRQGYKSDEAHEILDWVDEESGYEYKEEQYHEL